MANRHKVEVICIGSELLYDRVNTDINIISDIFSKIGLGIQQCTIVPDEEACIINAFAESLKRADIVVATGGLGPTSDDITRACLAKFLKRRLVYSKEIWESICEKFSQRGVVPAEINKKQAYILDKAEIISNLAGTAPGIIIKEGNKIIALLPGPPVELKPMAEFFAGQLKKVYPAEPFKIHRYGVSGTPESTVEEKIQPVMKKIGIDYTILAHPQMIEILPASGCPPEALKNIEGCLKKAFPDNYMGVNPPPLPEMLGNLLMRKKLKLAIAESCTGGLASKLITDIPGSSAYFQGAFIAYSNIIKEKTLKVPKLLLAKYGAVSAETAISMAKGAQKAGEADISLSFTGIAGPSGAAGAKPVGLVFIGVAMPDNKYEVFKFLFTGSREKIREQAVYKGFYLAIKGLKEFCNEK